MMDAERASRVARRLYLGPCESVESASELQACGISVVVNMASELRRPPSLPPNVEYRRIPLYDGDREWALPALCEAVALLAPFALHPTARDPYDRTKNLDDGNDKPDNTKGIGGIDNAKRVDERSALVHCYAGRSRSVLAAAGAIAFAQGLSPEAAMASVRAARPNAEPNLAYVAQLHVFSLLLRAFSYAAPDGPRALIARAPDRRADDASQARPCNVPAQNAENVGVLRIVQIIASFVRKSRPEHLMLSELTTARPTLPPVL